MGPAQTHCCFVGGTGERNLNLSKFLFPKRQVFETYQVFVQIEPYGQPVTRQWFLGRARLEAGEATLVILVC